MTTRLPRRRIGVAGSQTSPTWKHDERSPSAGPRRRADRADPAIDTLTMGLLAAPGLAEDLARELASASQRPAPHAHVR
ncbi:MAG: hypothetical protein QOC64_489, partial [Solirubrobacteraceae bacterium]|nr:hypothetical protein [Solirubrobacteraceae bacterium]